MSLSMKPDLISEAEYKGDKRILPYRDICKAKPGNLKDRGRAVVFRNQEAEIRNQESEFLGRATSLPLRFLILNILSIAGVEISAGSSVRGLGVRFHTSDIRRETSLNGPFYRVDIQLVSDGH
jgi:hypothetical protein